MNFIKCENWRNLLIFDVAEIRSYEWDLMWQTKLPVDLIYVYILLDSGIEVPLI